MRIEKDFIGEKKISAKALYGIHSVRAVDNFPDQTRFHKEWYIAIAQVKLACYNTYRSFKDALNTKYPSREIPIKILDDKIIDALSSAAQELIAGKHFDQFIVPAISGGAGTSINMNINEIIANRSLQILGEQLANYQIVDPIEHANVFQSTNDVIPTALKLASMKLLNELEQEINDLRAIVEQTERKYSNALRIAYTQMQEAVPSSYGKLFSTYNDALSRDWWRVSKCFERIKVINLGGSAVGTGVSVPRFFIMEVANELRKLTAQPLTRSENMNDATNNLDSLVEIHAIMKSHAVNLEKMVSDLRLLSSDIVGQGEMSIPNKQLGSSVMPGKVNPVIPEFVISVAHKIYNNDHLISTLSAQSCLDLNAYLPIIGHALLDSLKLLIAANKTIRENIFDGIEVNVGAGEDRLMRSPAITTALNPFIGYKKSAELAKIMKSERLDVFQANEKLQLIPAEKLKQIVKADNLLKTGFSIKEILEEE
ncbi:MAG: hypothetical protein JEZ03_09570 [Bacteroidales bacterium]|nr:hypothetical protein [Bacteroidales bacterium]